MDDFRSQEGSPALLQDDIKLHGRSGKPLKRRNTLSVDIASGTPPSAGLPYCPNT